MDDAGDETPCESLERWVCGVQTAPNLSPTIGALVYAGGGVIQGVVGGPEAGEEAMRSDQRDDEGLRPKHSEHDVAYSAGLKTSDQ